MNYLFDINREELLDAGEQCYIYGVLSDFNNFKEKSSQANVVSHKWVMQVQYPNGRFIIIIHKFSGSEFRFLTYKKPEVWPSLTYSTHLPDLLLTCLAQLNLGADKILVSQFLISFFLA